MKHTLKKNKINDVLDWLKITKKQKYKNIFNLVSNFERKQEIKNANLAKHFKFKVSFKSSF